MLKWIILGVLIIAFILVLRMLWEQKHFEITHYVLEDHRFDQNKKTFKTIVLGDLHNQSFGANNEKLIKAIDEIKPSCIFIVGDMPVAVPGKSTQVATALIEDLASKYPLYYGIGNHEYRMRIYPETYKDAYTQYNQCLLECGVDMMHNERRTLCMGNVQVDVYGLEMDRRYYKRFKLTPMDTEYLQKQFPQPKDGVFRILLAHSPDYFPTYAKWGADLTLSGHLHGGAVRIGKWGILSASTGLFPKYSGGWYEKDGKRMLVTRGLGAHTIPVRLFNRPELMVLEFKGKKD